MEPIFNDWDVVIIDQSDTEIQDGFHYILIYNGHLYIKTIRINFSQIILESANIRYEPIVIDITNTTDLKILGRVVHRSGFL